MLNSHRGGNITSRPSRVSDKGRGISTESAESSWRETRLGRIMEELAEKAVKEVLGK